MGLGVWFSGTVLIWHLPGSDRFPRRKTYTNKQNQKLKHAFSQRQQSNNYRNHSIMELRKEVLWAHPIPSLWTQVFSVLIRKPCPLHQSQVPRKEQNRQAANPKSTPLPFCLQSRLHSSQVPCVQRLAILYLSWRRTAIQSQLKYEGGSQTKTNPC